MMSSKSLSVSPKRMCLMLLSKKVFTPYYISHSMIMQFRQDGAAEISLADIIKMFNSGTHNHVK